MFSVPLPTHDFVILIKCTLLGIAFEFDIGLNRAFCGLGGRNILAQP